MKRLAMNLSLLASLSSSTAFYVLMLLKEACLDYSYRISKVSVH